MRGNIESGNAFCPGIGLTEPRELSQTLEMVTYPTNALLCRAGLLVVVISFAVDDEL